MHWQFISKWLKYFGFKEVSFTRCTPHKNTLQSYFRLILHYEFSTLGPRKTRKRRARCISMQNMTKFSYPEWNQRTLEGAINLVREDALWAPLGRALTLLDTSPKKNGLETRLRGQEAKELGARWLPPPSSCKGAAQRAATDGDWGSGQLSHFFHICGKS